MRQHASAFRRESSRNAPMVVLVFAYAAAVGAAAGIRMPSMASYFVQILRELCLYGLVTVTVLGIAYCLLVARPASPIRYFANAIVSASRTAALGRWAARLWPFALLAAAFSMFKPTISAHFSGFAWDAQLAELGRVMHFGIMPWRFLQPLFGHPWITRVLDVNYALWFAVMWMFLIGMIVFCRDEAHRQRSLMSFMLVWIVVGTCLAVAFPSAGPCYYGKFIAGPNPYAELMDYLQRTHDSIGLMAVDAQTALWNDYASGQPRHGISAMPSMHNAVAALMVFACWRYGIWLRLALSLHALLVFLGSILLGWHYGADAYVAWASAFILWRAAELPTRWWIAHLDQRGSERLIPQPA
ncbi:phosphatase PAP2 family protein [Aureimonas leprariae]|uniref:phosphatase PAP2 family protein n=1 Tax=Plantimonas leprariae TaxID=2615207 RepID=UPI0013870E57|nr:phosphatase PAP2 family protein [Aureimonas leprariae]